MKNYNPYNKNFDGRDNFKEFQKWVMKLQYHYRQDYIDECKRKKIKPNWFSGYYEYLLGREDAGS